MEKVRMFDAEEIEKATGINPREVVEIPGNDCAVRFWVEFDDIEKYEYDEEELEEIKNRNKIVEYFISQGVKEGEKVWIDVTW